jgi:Spy/CpxP family protein refolding chaperone
MWENARCFLVAGILMLAPILPAFAQRPGGGGPPPGGGVPGGPPGGGGFPGGPTGPRNIGGAADTRDVAPPNASSQPGNMSTLRGGFEFGPPGRWWDDKHFAKTLHIRPEQKKRMDTLFDENRANLVSRYQTLQQEQAKMEDLAHAQVLDEKALFAQIDRVTEALADLEKARTHLMLELRKEMDADQISRLENAR